MSEMHDLRRRLESHLERGGGLDASREASLAEQHARLATDVIEPEMTRLMDERDAARKHAASHVCGHTSPRPGDGALEAALEAADDHIQAQLDGRPETQCPGLRATDHAVLLAAIRRGIATYLQGAEEAAATELTRQPQNAALGNHDDAPPYVWHTPDIPHDPEMGPRVPYEPDD